MKEDTRRMYSVLNQLFEYKINTPDVVVYLGESIDANKNKVILEGMCKAIKRGKIKTVLRRIPGEPIKYLSGDEAYEKVSKLEEHEHVLLLKAPTSGLIYSGVCNVSALFGTISVDGVDVLGPNGNKDFKMAWKDKAIAPCSDLIHMVFRTLGPHSKSLDGLRLIFSYHEKSEGYLKDKLLFWGM